MTLEELAEKSGIALNTISRIERGVQAPQANTLHKLAEALGVPVAEFFRDEPEYTYPPKEDDPVGLPIRALWLPSTLSEAALPIGSNFLFERLGHAYLDWPVGDVIQETQQRDEGGVLELIQAVKDEEEEIRRELGRQYRRQRRLREYRGRIRQLVHLFTERMVALADAHRTKRVEEAVERILEEAHARA